MYPKEAFGRSFFFERMKEMIPAMPRIIIPAINPAAAGNNLLASEYSIPHLWM